MKWKGNSFGRQRVSNAHRNRVNAINHRLRFLQKCDRSYLYREEYHVFVRHNFLDPFPECCKAVVIELYCLIAADEWLHKEDAELPRPHFSSSHNIDETSRDHLQYHRHHSRSKPYSMFLFLKRNATEREKIVEWK